jgi:hypothetical protein
MWNKVSSIKLVKPQRLNLKLLYKLRPYAGAFVTFLKINPDCGAGFKNK